MANERLYQFPSKASPVPADLIYGADSANSNNEVNITIAALIAAYPNLSGIAGLTLGANTYPYSNNSAVLTAGSISLLGVSLLADTTINAMQTTLGYTATPTASLFAGWDANKNLTANSMIEAYTTTVTAGATTTLTVASTQQQFLTGSTTQTVVLPVTSTLVLGQSFYIVNNSSGNVTVESSGANTIQVMGANTTLLVTCILTSGTTATSWYADYNFQTAITLPLSIANGGTGVSSVTSAPTASAWSGWDANKNEFANNFMPAYATTLTAASTTTLTATSAYYQFFTGILTQTLVLPVASTLTEGASFYIVNNSSMNVTVQSSGANNIIVMAGSTTALLTCILNSGTTAASWNADYAQSGLTLPLSIANGGTNATTASTARSNLGAAASGANTDITSLIGLTGTIQAPTGITSSAGLNLLTFTYTANAVNYLSTVNAATGNNPSFTANGSDSTVKLGLFSKGGSFVLGDSGGGNGAGLFTKTGSIVIFDNTATNGANLGLASAAGTHSVGWQAPTSLSASIAWVLPSADGAAGTALVTNGAGITSYDGVTCKAWAQIATNGTINKGFNIASATSMTSGGATITFTNAMADAHYSVLVTDNSTSGQVIISARNLTTANFAVQSVISGAGTNTPGPYSIAVFD